MPFINAPETFDWTEVAKTDDGDVINMSDFIFCYFMSSLKGNINDSSSV
jgi:hypothetical protein